MNPQSLSSYPNPHATWPSSLKRCLPPFPLHTHPLFFLSWSAFRTQHFPDWSGHGHQWPSRCWIQCPMFSPYPAWSQQSFSLCSSLPLLWAFPSLKFQEATCPWLSTSVSGCTSYFPTEGISPHPRMGLILPACGLGTSPTAQCHLNVASFLISSLSKLFFWAPGLFILQPAWYLPRSWVTVWSGLLGMCWVWSPQTKFTTFLLKPDSP